MYFLYPGAIMGAPIAAYADSAVGARLQDHLPSSIFFHALLLTNQSSLCRIRKRTLLFTAVSFFIYAP